MLPQGIVGSFNISIVSAMYNTYFQHVSEHLLGTRLLFLSSSTHTVRLSPCISRSYLTFIRLIPILKLCKTCLAPPPTHEFSRIYCLLDCQSLHNVWRWLHLSIQLLFSTPQSQRVLANLRLAMLTSLVLQISVSNMFTLHVCEYVTYTLHVAVPIPTTTNRQLGTDCHEAVHSR